MKIKNEALRKLMIFLLQKRMTMGDFAKLANIHANHLSQIIGGKRLTSPTMASRIEQLSEGAVLPTDLKVGADRRYHVPVCEHCGQRIRNKKKSVEEKKEAD